MTKHISANIIYDLKSVREPNLSPDGKKLVYVKSSASQPDGKIDSTLEILTIDSVGTSSLTSGHTDSMPTYSPNGEWIGFLRKSAIVTNQIYIIPTLGGEALQITNHPKGVYEFIWSGDSQSLIFTGETIELNPTDVSKSPQSKKVTRIRYRQDSIGWRGNSFRHVFTININSLACENIIPLPLQEGDCRSIRISPNGKTLALVSDSCYNRDISNTNGLYLIDLDSGKYRCASQGLYNVDSSTWAPDSKRLAIVGSTDDRIGASWGGYLYIIDPDQNPRQITDDRIRPSAGYSPIAPPPELGWTNKDEIIFLGEKRGESFLCKVQTSGDDLTLLTEGGALINSISLNLEHTTAILSVTPPDRSDYLELLNIEHGESNVLLEPNRDYFKEHSPAKMNKFSIVRNGFEIESRIFLPPEFDSNAIYPMVVDIHGGPSGVFMDSFNLTQQVLAANGYVVLAVNPRGSATYGNEFMRAVIGDWGGEDYLDIMQSVEHLCSKTYIDEGALGITGYSYGGYMASWIIGHEKRFKAAVIGAPVTNLRSFYGTSDIGVRFSEIQLQSRPEENTGIFNRLSPLNYAQNVEAAVLLLHGEEDYRCPIEQSEQYFVALKRNGKIVEFVRFPDSSHSMLRLGHPKFKSEYLQRTVNWFGEHLTTPVTQG